MQGLCFPAADVRPVVVCADCKYNNACLTQAFVEDESKVPFDRNTFFCADGKRADIRKSPLNPNTRYKILNGITADIAEPTKLHPAEVIIRVTHDKRGKSLSLEDGERLIMIPLEPVTDLIDTTF